MADVKKWFANLFKKKDIEQYKHNDLRKYNKKSILIVESTYQEANYKVFQPCKENNQDWMPFVE